MTQAVKYDATWDSETLELTFQQNSAMLDMDISWAEGIDNKVVALFSVSSAIVGIAPTLNEQAKTVGTVVFWVFALIAWAAAAWQCYQAYSPRDFVVGPNPSKSLDPKWLRLSPSEYRFYAIRDMGEAHDANRAQIGRKAKHLDSAMFATAVEVLCLAIAFFVF